MATKPRKKRPSCKELPPPQISVDFKRFIRVNEERWLIKRMKFDAIFEELHDLATGFNKGQIRCILWHHCEIYGKTKLKRESKSTLLDEAAWDRVKTVATAFQSKFESLTLDECIVLMRTRIAVNRSQMLGLPKRLKTWIKTKK